MSKTLYQSELVEMGEVDAEIRSEPTASKYRGQPDFVVMNIDGEERRYNCENDDCARALEGLKGKTVRLVAEGSRENATIEILDEAPQRGRQQTQSRERREPERPKQDRTSPARERSEPEKKAPPTPEERAAEEEQAFRRAKVYGLKCKVLMQIAHKCVLTFLEEEGLKDMTTEDERALTNTMFIELKAQTDIRKLPTKWRDTKPAPKATPPPPKPEPKPERPPQDPAPDPDALQEDDIPF